MNEVFFMLPNAFIEFGLSLCGQMPVPGGLPDLPACPAVPSAGNPYPGVDPGQDQLIKISNTHVSFGDQDQAEIVQFCNRCQMLMLMLYVSTLPDLVPCLILSLAHIFYAPRPLPRAISTHPVHRTTTWSSVAR